MSHHFRVKLVFYKGFHAPVIVTIRTACGYRLVKLTALERGQRAPNPIAVASCRDA